MNLGGKQMIVGPFGTIIESPTCPYCGCDISVWAVQSMKHTQECYMNPQVIEKMEQAAENLKKYLKEAKP